MKYCPVCNKEYEDTANFCKDGHGKLEVKAVETGVTCPNCGAENPANSKFCNECGAKITAITYKCSKCGKEYDNAVKFCNECGEKITSDPKENERTKIAKEFLDENDYEVEDSKQALPVSTAKNDDSAAVQVTKKGKVFITFAGKKGKHQVFGNGNYYYFYNFNTFFGEKNPDECLSLLPQLPFAGKWRIASYEEARMIGIIGMIGYYEIVFSDCAWRNGHKYKLDHFLSNYSFYTIIFICDKK